MNIKRKNRIKNMMHGLRLNGLYGAMLDKKIYGNYTDRIQIDLNNVRDLVGSKHTREHEAKKTVFLINFTNMISQAKLDGFLGKAIGNKQVYAVFDHRSSIKKSYYKAFGICNFIYIEDFIQYNKISEYIRMAHDFCSSFEYETLASIKYGSGFELGKQVLSTIGRKHKCGSSNWDGEAYSEEVIEMSVIGMQYYDAMIRIIEKYMPDLALANEINYVYCAAVTNAMIERGIPVVQYVSSADGKGLVFKRRTTFSNLRINANSADRSSLEKTCNEPLDSQLIVQQIYDQYYNNLEVHNVGKQIKTKEEIEKELNLDPRKKNVVLFSHVMWDANMFYGRDLYSDFEEWFVETVKAGVKNDKVNWIIKIHPANAWKSDAKITREEELIDQAIGMLPNHMHVVYPDTEINTLSLYMITDVGITVRGTVGMELPCLGIPVLTAGTGRYSGLGFTNDSESIEDYENKLANAQKMGKLDSETTIIAQRYYNIVRNRIPYNFDGIRRIQNKNESIASPFVTDIIFDDCDSLFDNSEIKRLIKWLFYTNDIDSL